MENNTAKESIFCLAGLKELGTGSKAKGQDGKMDKINLHLIRILMFCDFELLLQYKYLSNYNSSLIVI